MKKKIIIPESEVEKLIKTIKNPNVNRVKKLRAKNRLVSGDVWDNDNEKYITMTSKELYELQGK